MRRRYVFPVPYGMTPEEAFAECRVFGELAEGREVGVDGEGGGWASIEMDDDDAEVRF